MDPIGQSVNERNATQLLKSENERERELDAIVQKARKLRPVRRKPGMKTAALPDLGLDMPTMGKQPTESPAMPAPMPQPPSPSPPTLTTSSPPPPGIGPAPVTPQQQPTASPAMPAPVPSDPFPARQAPPIAGPGKQPTASPASPASPAEMPMPPPPTASMPPPVPRAEPTSPMPGEPTGGDMPPPGGSPPAPEGAPPAPGGDPGAPADPSAPPAIPPTPAGAAGPQGTPGAPSPFPNSPSATMFYNLAGRVGGDAGRNFVMGLPQWAQQYGLPIGGGLAGLLGMYLLSRFMGNREKRGEEIKTEETTYGKDAWNSAPGKPLPAGTKMSQTAMSNHSC